jgi:hypothetical protein
LERFLKVQLRSVTTSNKAGFAAMGIYPFHTNAIPDETFAPSKVTEHNTVETKLLANLKS